MVARRYRISLRVFNSIAQWTQWTSEMSIWKREEKFHICKQPCIIYHLHLHVSFTCINSPSLTRKVDFIKEWNKGIDNCLRSQDENICWITTKTNNGPNFQYRKLSVIKLVLTDGRNLSGSRPKSAYGKYFSARFPFSAARNFFINDTEYVGFGFFFFRILVFFPSLQSLNVSSHKPKKFDKSPWIGNGEGFAVCSSTRRSGAKEEWRFSSWLAISNTREKDSYFFRRVVTAFLRAENPSITPQFTW